MADRLWVIRLHIVMADMSKSLSTPEMPAKSALDDRFDPAPALAGHEIFLSGQQQSPCGIVGGSSRYRQAFVFLKQKITS